MRHMNSHILVLVLILIGNTSLVQASWKSDLKELQKTYNLSSSYRAQITHSTLYDSAVVEINQATVVYAKGHIYTKIREIELFSDGVKTVTVEHNQKIVVVSPPKNQPSSTMINFDSAARYVVSATSKELPGGLIRHRLYFDQGDYQWIEIELTRDKHQIKSITQKHRAKHLTENDESVEVITKVVYDKIEHNPDVKNTDFSASNYLDYNSATGEFQLTPAMKSYELVLLI